MEGIVINMFFGASSFMHGLGACLHGSIQLHAWLGCLLCKRKNFALVM